MQAIGEPESAVATPSAMSKTELEALSDAARASVIRQVQLADRTDVPRFRLANELIEQYRQVARFTRRIAEQSA